MINSPKLLKTAFDEAVKNQKTSPFPFLIDPFDSLSIGLDRSKIQSSSSARLYKLATLIADALVDEKGIVPFDRLDLMVDELKKNLYWVGPSREKDTKGRQHMLRALSQLRENKELGRLLSTIDRPENHPVAERLIRNARNLQENQKITKRDAVAASLSAWLTPLRQSIGSCFATAPAIIVQQEHPHYLLQDLSELLATGRLTRTFGGNSYQAPLSASFGIGDLNRQALFVSKAPKPYEDLSHSQGLQEAFTKMGLIDQSQEELYSLLEETFSGELKEKNEIILTIEEVLQRGLLHRLKITENDLKEHALRPKRMIYSSLMIEKKRNGAMSKSDACTHFEHLLAIGKGAFVSLTDNPLLKAWEFTLASFAETKANFATWNLYSSLGLDPNEPGGIGQAMHRQILMQLEEKNRKTQELQEEYKMVYHQLMLAEGRLKSAESEDQARWVRADYQIKRNEFNSLEEMRDKEHRAAERLANLYNDLVEYLLELFPKYFQEVYDPDLHDVTAGPYDDAPAGFRLLYKHGRSNTSTWTFVHNYGEFISALDQFFIALEREIDMNDLFEGLEKEVSEIITHICIHIKSKEFIETAFKRMAAYHRTEFVEKPLDNLEKIEKKPWAYTSGGGMDKLVSNYFSLEDPPKEVSRWVESPQELLLFIVDTVKQMPHNESDEFLKKDYHSLLMHSPTHAFRALPGLHPFNKCWQRKEFTYTLVRDEFINPQKQFFEHMRLDSEMIADLIASLKERVPEPLHQNYQEAFNFFPSSLLPKEFREHFTKALQRDPLLRLYGPHLLSEESIDSLLYRNLPYTHGYRIEELLNEAFSKSGLLPKGGEKIINDLIGAASRFDLFSSVALQEICSAILLNIFGRATFANEHQKTLIESLQKMELLPPPPLLFADTNWEGDYFAFVVSPSTLELELWRMNPLGRNGAPMSSWKRWLNGNQKKPDWGLYTQPEQYS